jgi:hypothetical protein
MRAEAVWCNRRIAQAGILRLDRLVFAGAIHRMFGIWLLLDCVEIPTLIISFLKIGPRFTPRQKSRVLLDELLL